ncbi:MAG: TatD family hydrolase [Candidatus Pacebacteria bacterium]|nr:TatD family hydrolase [Candidatus Paceibacterota bacterium]
MSNKFTYIDIHGHINFPDYDIDRQVAIERAQEAGVGMITVGTGIESSRQAIKLAEAHENMWAIVGIHPTDAKDLTDTEFSELQELAAHPKVVAIGECGLDYFHSQPEEMGKQRDIFIQHIELANSVNKPLMLHVRNGKTAEHNAYQEVIAILKEKAKVHANFHFFAGTLQDAQDIIAMGNTVSFTGVLSFARNYDEIVKNIPLESIMSETDCPFVAPVPYRGKRNEPSYVIETVKKIAEIRGEDLSIVSSTLLNTAKKFFKIQA